MMRARLTEINGRAGRQASASSRDRARGLRRARAEPHLVGRARRRQPHRRGPLVARRRWRRPLVSVATGVRGAARAEARRPGHLRRRRRSRSRRRSPASARCSGTPSSRTSSWCSRRACSTTSPAPDDQRPLRAASSGRRWPSWCGVSRGIGVRHRRAAGAGARRDGQGGARGAERVPVHAARGPDGAARRGAGDARRAPLRERDAAHAGREPARGVAGRARGVHGARHCSPGCSRPPAPRSPAISWRAKCSS